jgi:hypothetical protein
MLEITYLEAWDSEAWRILCACPNLFQGDSTNIYHQVVLLYARNHLPECLVGLEDTVRMSTLFPRR